MSKSKKNGDIYTMLPRFVTEAEPEPENPRFLRMIERSFERSGIRFKFEIVPACILVENVGTSNFYPGAAEEVMEIALRRLAVEDNPEFDKSESTLVFSLTEIKAELEEVSAGKSYSREQIERSLAILCRVGYELSDDRRHLCFHALDGLLEKEKHGETHYMVQFSALFLNGNELFDSWFQSRRSLNKSDSPNI